MAEFLNKLGDFTVKSAAQQEPLTLLPPSVFEKPRTSHSGQADARLKKAADEIQALKLENQKLRDRFDGSLTVLGTVPSQTGSSGQGAVMHGGGDSERRYADELICRQAEELSQLRSKVNRLETEGERLRQDSLHQLEAAGRERQESVMALSDSLMRKDEDHREEVAELRQQHEGEVLDLTSRLDHLAADLEHSKGDLTSQVTDLTAELLSVRQQAKEKGDSLEQQLREKEGEALKQSHQIHQLKTYIMDSEQQHRPQQVWVQQCETLANKLQIAEAEKETLESTVQLLNIRLNSVKEILLTQEMELSKGKEELIDKNKVKELLLTRWRNKVYSLLVQQKSSQMVGHKDLQNWKEKIEVLEEKLSSAHNAINILKHTVAEKEADLQLAHNTTKGLQHQMGQAEQVALCLEDEINKDAAAVQQLAESAQSFEGQFQQQSLVLQQALGQLKALGQRVSFASSRMDVLQSQFSRKQALKHLEGHQHHQHQQHQQKADPEPVDTDTEHTWRLESDHLQEELSRVSHERDVLAAQLQQDSHTWTENIASLRTQYDSEVSSLKRTVEDLESSNQQKSQLLERANDQLQTAQSELEEARECRDQLGTELARHQHTTEQALEEQRKRSEQEFTEHLADMEGKLNDARREHTKAVVTLRQRERQWSREQERKEEEMGVAEAHHQAELERLHHHLKTVETERNLFMATLRQEGLLGKLRSERREPMTLVLEGEEEEASSSQPEDSNSATLVTETESLQAAHDSSEPVSAVLEDLKSLVPAVLDDSLDSSDDNQD